ncbi:nicotinamide riboside transporter PnuC [Rurimicrobium arvi]|uniref:Nicotinamide riboside transporter PnuC n=1 Tax=Rurimicrobium arvi TaxID=2049916 RepID=A0ABP8MIB3_9BACT
MTAWIHEFLVQVKSTSWLEWLAAVFGVFSVLFAQRNHILLYPTGLVSTGIYAYLLSRREAGLYAEALLNTYYFVMTLYGWWHWKRGDGAAELVISICNTAEWFITIGIVLILWPLFWYLLGFTPSTVPGWDSFVSATACAGMWLLARRKVENWILLNLSNLVAIPLFAYKGYYVTMLLTVFLFIVAIFGYFSWRRLYRLRTAAF